jgi:hypothetical protein
MNVYWILISCVAISLVPLVITLGLEHVERGRRR